jgi:ribosomal protein S6
LYEAPGEVPRELERNFHLDEEVLRYLTVLAPPEPAGRPEAAASKGTE